MTGGYAASRYQRKFLPAGEIQSFTGKILRNPTQHRMKKKDRATHNIFIDGIAGKGLDNLAELFGAVPAFAGSGP